MAGIVFVSGSSHWDVSSSVFCWAVDTLADRVASADLVERLRTISDDNLGSLRLSELTPEQRSELVAHIGALPRVADETLPPSPERHVVVAQLQELADLVAAAG
ncbi:hypothetical protein [Cellulomonas sp. NS3]|uniref:hypothetical protein n=1 Tax=Cellulomonas sp. NS3 TaxID=2973977 RepID=UPI002161D67F|nr:hypothetical protein [Cellulomonas sp. NS3]